MLRRVLVAMHGPQRAAAAAGRIAMRERYLGRVDAGMDVCDIRGEKIGTIARIHRDATTAGVSGAPFAPSKPAGETLEVTTGFLGLGKHFYVPREAVKDGAAGSVFLGIAREELQEHGWDRKPAGLP
jgi:hypothetical protein